MTILEINQPTPKKKICKLCGQEKSLFEFFNKAEGKDGKDSLCKLCKMGVNKQNLTKTTRMADCHPDRPYFAKGFCYSCYHRQGTLLVINSMPSKPKCVICADGYEPKSRQCQLFPNICDYCETEYCPCGVKCSDDETLDRLKGRLALEIKSFHGKNDSEELEVVAGLASYRRLLKKLSDIYGGRKFSSLLTEDQAFRSLEEASATSNGLVSMDKP